MNVIATGRERIAPGTVHAHPFWMAQRQEREAEERAREDREIGDLAARLAPAGKRDLLRVICFFLWWEQRLVLMCPLDIIRGGLLVAQFRLMSWAQGRSW